MSGRPRVLRVVFYNASCAYVSGHGSRSILTDLRGGRAPVWSATERAWAVQPRTARDVIAVAESRGWSVEVETVAAGGSR